MNLSNRTKRILCVTISLGCMAGAFATIMLLDFPYILLSFGWIGIQVLMLKVVGPLKKE